MIMIIINNNHNNNFSGWDLKEIGGAFGGEKATSPESRNYYYYY